VCDAGSSDGIGLFLDKQSGTRFGDTNKRVPVIWLQLQDCTGCSESFIRSTHPKIESVLLDMISLEYSELLSAASVSQAEGARQSVIEKYQGEYILAVEGSVPLEEYYATIGGVSVSLTPRAAWQRR
jgi:hydrogenase small subunit